MPEKKGKVDAVAKGKATVALKVIRADGTEESFVSHDVTVTDASAVAELIANMAPAGPATVTAEEAEQRNAEESRRNAEANERVARQEG